jgi:hypothetical protein
MPTTIDQNILDKLSMVTPESIAEAKMGEEWSKLENSRRYRSPPIDYITDSREDSFFPNPSDRILTPEFEEVIGKWKVFLEEQHSNYNKQNQTNQ